ncbi:MAG: type II secretion system F family protein [Planctomycetales bacterium]|nr:type II secretion system F family protein [Planctomycetales bacterium]
MSAIPVKQFNYTATTADGSLVEGEIQAANVSQAVALLEADGFSLLSIALVQASSPDAGGDSLRARLCELVSRRSQWLPLLEAIEEELPPGSTKREARRLARLLKSDIDPDDLLLKPDAIALWPLLATDLDSANLTQRITSWLENTIRYQQAVGRRRRLMLYPLILLLVGLALIIFSSWFVVPIFRSMFDEFGLHLPAPTKFVFWISDLLTVHGLRTAIGVALFAAALYVVVVFWRRHAITNYLFGRWVAGTSVNLRACSVLANSLADLLNLGVPLPIAVRAAGLSCKHVYFERAAEGLADALDQISAGASPLVMRLPPTFLMAIGMSGGQQPNTELLQELATIYAERANRRTDWLAACLPSMMICIVGIGVGFLVIALFMPLVSMVTSLA